MRKLKIIGLTGQSGAGKTTVSEVLSKKGLTVINADLLVRELYKVGSPCLKILSAQFGEEVINADGTLNRAMLAEKVFSSKENTQLLNSLIHPFVISLFLEKAKNAQKIGERTLVFDAPQLFESKADVICDKVIAVVACKEKRIQRICLRDNISKEEAIKRIDAQLSEDFFRANSDYVIENNLDLDALKKQTLELLDSLMY